MSLGSVKIIKAFLFVTVLDAVTLCCEDQEDFGLESKI